jgi:putative ABC transport system permease protein
VNLSTVALISRIKEIGIRKTTGAYNANIFIQFLAESLLTCILATSLAFLFAHALIPVFEIVLGKPIDFLKLTFLNVFIILSGVLLIGILSGTIPALIATNYSPVQILSKNKIFLKKPFFKNGLTMFQFIISIVIIFSLFAILKQIKLVQNRDIGFDTSCLINVDYPGDIRKSDVIKEYLTKTPNIINVSFTNGNPMDIGEYSGSNKPIKAIAIMSADEKFVGTLNLKFLHGRNINYPSKIKECLITENAFKESGWQNLDGKIFKGHNVVGVVNTFNNDDLHKFPSNIMIQNDFENGFSGVTIRISSLNKPETLRFIKQIWDTNFPDYGFRYTFYDEWIKNMFIKEQNDARIALIFGIFSIILSCLGLFGLAEYSIKNKIKEIGIRKVNGARIGEIMFMLNKDFVKLVLLAFIIACPIAWYSMHQWLQNFAYKTPLSWWVFALAGFVVLVIALVTVSWQSWRAATRNPVEALRYE